MTPKNRINVGFELEIESVCPGAMVVAPAALLLLWPGLQLADQSNRLFPHRFIADIYDHPGRRNLGRQILEAV